jgi:hypothetical protein
MLVPVAAGLLVPFFERDGYFGATVGFILLILDLGNVYAA